MSDKTKTTENWSAAQAHAKLAKMHSYCLYCNEYGGSHRVNCFLQMRENEKAAKLKRARK